MPKSADLLRSVGYSFFTLGLIIALLSIYVMLTTPAYASLPEYLDSAIYLSVGLLVCAGTLLVGLPFVTKGDAGFASTYVEENAPQVRHNLELSSNTTESPSPSELETNEE